MAMITLKVEGYDDGAPGASTIAAMVAVFEGCLNLVAEKEKMYAGTWRRQGWMGNMARVLSKTERLKNMLWRDGDLNYRHATDTPLDNILDLINLATFLDINYEDGNRWGT